MKPSSHTHLIKLARGHLQWLHRTMLPSRVSAWALVASLVAGLCVPVILTSGSVFVDAIAQDPDQAFEQYQEFAFYGYQIAAATTLAAKFVYWTQGLAKTDYQLRRMGWLLAIVHLLDSAVMWFLPEVDENSVIPTLDPIIWQFIVVSFDALFARRLGMRAVPIQLGLTFVGSFVLRLAAPELPAAAQEVLQTPNVVRMLLSIWHLFLSLFVVGNLFRANRCTLAPGPAAT